MTAEHRSTYCATEKTAHQIVHPKRIPHELLDCPQWVCWRYVDRGEGRKPDKQPVNPRNMANAGIHWANTWAPFEVAYEVYTQHGHRRVHGIGFVLTPKDPYVAIDLDACIQEDERTVASLPSPAIILPERPVKSLLFHLI
jgi:hypothetical protein